MDEELKRLQATWQAGVPADLDVAFRRAAAKADRGRRWGRWMLAALLLLLLPLLWPSALGWYRPAEQALVWTLATVGLVVGVVALLRWPRVRLQDAGPPTVRKALETLLRDREHRLWLWTGWLPRIGWLVVLFLMATLLLWRIVLPGWDANLGHWWRVLAGGLAYTVMAIVWREIASMRIEADIDRLRLTLVDQVGSSPAPLATAGGIPRPRQRRVLLACEGIVIVIAVVLAWRGSSVDPGAAREYMDEVMMTGAWADSIRQIEAGFQPPEGDTPPSADDVARYCRVRTFLAPALREMQGADWDLRVGVRLSLLGEPDGKDMAAWQSAAARWERARGHLLTRASRGLSSARMGPARLRWVGEWIEWRTLGRSEAAGFALRGADARRWFGLRLRLAALSLSRTSVSDGIQSPDHVSRLERARADAASELALLEQAARARSAGRSGMSLDACPQSCLEPIDNIAWLALLDTPESPWDEAAW